MDMCPTTLLKKTCHRAQKFPVSQKKGGGLQVQQVGMVGESRGGSGLYEYGHGHTYIWHVCTCMVAWGWFNPRYYIICTGARSCYDTCPNQYFTMIPRLSHVCKGLPEVNNVEYALSFSTNELQFFSPLNYVTYIQFEVCECPL